MYTLFLLWPVWQPLPAGLDPLGIPWISTFITFVSRALSAPLENPSTPGFLRYLLQTLEPIQPGRQPYRIQYPRNPPTLKSPPPCMCIFWQGFEDPAVFRDAQRVRASRIEQSGGIRGGEDELRKKPAAGSFSDRLGLAPVGFSDRLDLPERPESDR